VDALIPGLDRLGPDVPVEVGFHFSTPPRIEFTTADRVSLQGQGHGGEAAIRVHLGGIEMILRDASRPAAPLGSVSVTAATITVVPYRGPLGGISFELVENDWKLDSQGVEFDEEILAATLGELVFGEAFETRYAPIATELFKIGRAGFVARGFELEGDYLVVGLGEGGAPAPPGVPAPTDAVVVSQANR
jgi:hypothetical protein